MEVEKPNNYYQTNQKTVMTKGRILFIVFIILVVAIIVTSLPSCDFGHHSDQLSIVDSVAAKDKADSIHINDSLMHELDSIHEAYDREYPDTNTYTPTSNQQVKVKGYSIQVIVTEDSIVCIQTFKR